MKTFTTVKELMCFIKDSDLKNVTLISSCSDQVVYSNFYSNFPYEMKEAYVTSIEIQQEHIILYIL